MRLGRLLNCLFSCSREPRIIHRWIHCLGDILCQRCCREVSFPVCGKCGPTPKHSGEKQAAQSLQGRPKSIPAEVADSPNECCVPVSLSACIPASSCCSVYCTCVGANMCFPVLPSLLLLLLHWIHGTYWGRKYSTVSDCLQRGAEPPRLAKE